MDKPTLPVPRLQLRWEASPHPRYQWQCNYELVILLGEHDVRREVYRDGELLKRKLPREFTIPMKEPTHRETSNPFPPCTSCDGKQRYADEPYRDGAHARWDAIQLGDLPIFVIAPDGEAFEVKYDPAAMRQGD